MKTFRPAIVLLSLASLLLGSCSMFTAQGRQERAYAHYVRKASLGRLKQQKRMSKSMAKIPEIQPSEPKTATEVSGPEAVGDGSGQ
ncbi:MAG: hypothetical protein H0T83_03185 [Chthoniobacterales bacterium]|nr:hypothetical protein [Chthoniobacterales bacterium]